MGNNEKVNDVISVAFYAVNGFNQAITGDPLNGILNAIAIVPISYKLLRKSASAIPYFIAGTSLAAASLEKILQGISNSNKFEVGFGVGEGMISLANYWMGCATYIQNPQSDIPNPQVTSSEIQ